VQATAFDELAMFRAILTKKFGARPRDADDIRWLENLKGSS
jgi:hypothetical protein